MRKLLLRVVDNILHHLFGSPAELMVHYGRELGKMAEAELFIEGRFLDHLEITPLDDGYWIDIYDTEESEDETTETE